MKIKRRQASTERFTDTAVHPLLRRVYAARGITSEAELNLELKHLLPPGDLPDIDIAAARLAEAVRQQQRILIVGDFDADGATSVALCVLVLRAFGAADVHYLVPNRFEYGYGLSTEIVDLAAELEPHVIVTVDNGVSSVAGVARAAELGIDVIVTDHHLPGEQRPAALALVNPNLPESTFASRAMAGVGVAYYVLSRVRAELQSQGHFDQGEVPNLAQYLDLVALGTVADVVPLDANNRRLVQQGLLRMRAGQCRPGIRALVEIGKRQLGRLTEQDLGFAVGPRLNAAGRLQDMSIGIRCLLADSLGEARELATALDQLNQARRALEADMVGDAELLLAEQSLSADRWGIAVYHEGFHQGVVGIVAGRLREQFFKPAIVFADAGDLAPDELKGSARSIPGLHIRDALDLIATRYPGLLLKFGGHAMAAGLSIKRVHMTRFSVIFDKVVKELVPEEQMSAQIVTDGELEPEYLSLEAAQMLTQAGPWGAAFPEPCFDAEFDLIEQRVVGETHLKLVLKCGERVIDAIAFRQPPLPTGTRRVLAVYRLAENDYRDRVTLQLIVEHLEALS